MRFDDEDIRKYRELCRKYFDEEIDDETAEEELRNLIFMVELIYHPLTAEKLAKLHEKTDPGPR